MARLSPIFVAAQELDRRFVGIELNADHHRTASSRVQRLQAV
jgi:DNA modification methylase